MVVVFWHGVPRPSVDGVDDAMQDGHCCQDGAQIELQHGHSRESLVSAPSQRRRKGWTIAAFTAIGAWPRALNTSRQLLRARIRQLLQSSCPGPLSGCCGNAPRFRQDGARRAGSRAAVRRCGRDRGSATARLRHLPPVIRSSGAPLFPSFAQSACRRPVSGGQQTHPAELAWRALQPRAPGERPGGQAWRRPPKRPWSMSGACPDGQTPWERGERRHPGRPWTPVASEPPGRPTALRLGR